jgi:uncharacterized membrane protein
LYQDGLRPNSEYKAEAKYQLRGRWMMAVLVILITWIITQAFASRGASYTWINGEMVRTETSGANGFASIISLIVSGPLNLGAALYFLKFPRGLNSQLEDLFSGFRNFGNALLLHILSMIFVILWSLLLIVPGIIAAISYTMAYYIMNDNPGMSATEALRASKELMRGNKGKFFAFVLSFAGWFLLGILSFGIGLLWVGAYYNTAKANFYQDLKRNSLMGDTMNSY